jgi:CelD/BcsL family acetyltransferase involved in cellulose biosynthesis
MLRVECVRDIVQLDALKADWDRLSNGAIMRSYDWMRAWYAAFCSDHDLQILIVKRDNEVLGIMPLAQTKHAWTGATLVFTGCGKVCSDDLGILCREADAALVAEACCKHLADSQQSYWDHLNLDGVRDEDVSMREFLRSMESLTGTSAQYKASPSCWSISIEGGWDAYKTRLSKRARKILNQAEKQCLSGSSQFHIAETKDQAQQYLSEIEQLHQSRWREQGIEGCFSEPNFTSFLNHAIDRMWQHPGLDIRPSVEIGIVRIGGEAAAGTICLRDRHSMAMYLTGMSPEFADVRPGWQVTCCFIKRAIELGYSRFDLMRGDEEYKARLGAVATTQRRFLIASPRWSSQLRSAVYRTAVQVKNWWKPVINSPVIDTQAFETSTLKH